MYSTTHQFGQRVVDEPVTLQRRFSGEVLRDDQQAVVSALARAGVPGMLRGIVVDFEPQRGKESESFPQQRFDVAHAGKAFLNGLIVTSAYTPAAT